MRHVFVFIFFVIVFIFFPVVNKSFCQIIKIDSVLSVKKYTRIVENKVHVYDVLKIGKDTFQSDLFFADTEFFVIHNSYNLQSYISTELKFRNKTFRPKDAIILSNGLYSFSDIDFPLTYEPSEWLNTGILYYQLKELDNEFVILDIGPYGCGGSACAYGFYFIFNFFESDAKLFVIPHRYSQPFGFEDNLFMVKDGELYLKLYIENEDRECGNIYNYKLQNDKLLKLNLFKKECWGK